MQINRYHIRSKYRKPKQQQLQQQRNGPQPSASRNTQVPQQSQRENARPWARSPQSPPGLAPPPGFSTPAILEKRPIVEEPAPQQLPAVTTVQSEETQLVEEVSPSTENQAEIKIDTPNEAAIVASQPVQTEKEEQAMQDSLAEDKAAPVVQEHEASLEERKVEQPVEAAPEPVNEEVPVSAKEKEPEQPKDESESVQIVPTEDHKPDSKKKRRTHKRTTRKKGNTPASPALALSPRGPGINSSLVLDNNKQCVFERLKFFVLNLSVLVILFLSLILVG